MSDAIEASTVRCTTLSDGTLRLSVDIEPAMAQAAFALFGTPGRAVALAALRDGRAAVAPAPAVTPAEQGRARSTAQIERWDSLGTLTKAAISIGGAPEFWAWARVTNSSDAADFIKRCCGVQSRKELDSNPVAARIFRSSILEPYRRHMTETTH